MIKKNYSLPKEDRQDDDIDIINQDNWDLAREQYDATIEDKQETNDKQYQTTIQETHKLEHKLTELIEENKQL